MSVRLFVAEDTEHVRKMLVDILGLHGFDIVGQASSGEETVLRAAKADPDVVVMDLKMPGMDGLEAAQRLREVRPNQQIVLYSAFLDDDVSRRAREAGVAVCVPKLAGVEALAREITAVAMALGK